MGCRILIAVKLINTKKIKSSRKVPNETEGKDQVRMIRPFINRRGQVVWQKLKMF